MNKTIKYAIVGSFAAIALGLSWTTAMIMEQGKRTDYAHSIRKSEVKISKLRRENEDLSVKIAEQENPTYLGSRASARLVRPKTSAVVWGYENFKGGRVEFAPDNQKMLSFRMPEKSENKNKN